MKKDERIAIRLTKDMKDKLEKLAEADNRSLSNYIIKVLSEHIKNSKARN
jgi:uncharacterized protein (DUF1778 family)